jgi:hypothetical protein
MKLIALSILVLAFTACSSQDPCVRLHNWNYTDEWFFQGDERFQVYKTWTGKRFIYVLNTDSTHFKRKTIQ